MYYLVFIRYRYQVKYKTYIIKLIKAYRLKCTLFLNCIIC